MNTPHEVTFVTGCSFLLTRSLIKTIGTLDNRFFAYFEDAAYSITARKNGFFCFCVPSAIVYHNESSSLGKKSITYTYLFSRNRILFALNHLPKVLVPYYMIFFTLKLLLVLPYFMINKESGRALAYLKGYRDGILQRGGKIHL